jgi:hypothetical protein
MRRSSSETQEPPARRLTPLSWSPFHVNRTAVLPFGCQLVQGVESRIRACCSLAGWRSATTVS